MYMTNKRFVWIEDSRTISVPVSSVLDYKTYTDGILLVKQTGKPLLVRWLETDRLATTLAARLISDFY
jgi:hypothetical protein